MGTMLQLTDDAVLPAPGTAVLKAAEYATFREASEILETARTRAEEIVGKAQDAYEERRRAGYLDGLEEGKLEMAGKMMETIISSVEFVEKIESTVVDVVNQSVRKVIGELDDAERVVRIVRTALSNVRGQQHVVVRVNPSDEPEVSRSLAAMAASSYLSVVAEARLPKDSCILESELGVVDASLHTQLKALELAFSKKIAK